MSTRSTTPLNWSSAPTGIWIGTGRALQAVDDGLDGMQEVRANAVHLVDEADAGHAILVGLAPNGFRLRLHARTASKIARAVEHPQRALDFRREITWPGVSIMLIVMSRQ